MSRNATTALGISLVSAIILLITVILPAEYSYDPLGTGELLGVLGMSDAPDDHAYESVDGDYRSHNISFELAPFEYIEIKYQLEADAAMLFHWQSTGEIVWDLHAEPDGAPEGFAESFAAGRNQHNSGSYLARFDGIHGWFFENRLSENVTVDLEVVGFFNKGITYRGGYPDPFDVPENEL